MKSLILSFIVGWIVCLPGSGGYVQKGLLVIPGLGRSDRLLTVISNLRILRKDYIKSYGINWDCIVYIYAPPELSSFWSNIADLEYLRSECKVVEVPNQRVTENLYMVRPDQINQEYQKVLIMLDDCRIQDAGAFNLTKILKIMAEQQLTVASPMVRLQTFETIVSLFFSYLCF